MKGSTRLVAVMNGSFRPTMCRHTNLINIFSCSCDFVQLIYNTGQIIKFLGGFKPLYTFTVDGNTTDTLRVRFDSDSSVRRRGFLAYYYIAPCK